MQAPKFGYLIEGASHGAVFAVSLSAFLPCELFQPLLAINMLLFGAVVFGVHRERRAMTQNCPPGVSGDVDASDSGRGLQTHGRPFLSHLAAPAPLSTDGQLSAIDEYRKPALRDMQETRTNIDPPGFIFTVRQNRGIHAKKGCDLRPRFDRQANH
jgi:hypothetical protein